MMARKVIKRAGRARRWGNALGGWRKQRRNRDGTFGSGSGGAARKTKAKAKKSSSSSRSPKKSRVKKAVSAKKTQAKSYAKKQKANAAKRRATTVKEEKGLKGNKRIQARQAAYSKHSYSKPGGLYRNRRDSILGQGSYSPYGKAVKTRQAGRIAGTAAAATLYPAIKPVLGVSYVRHRRYTKKASNQNEYTLTTRRQLTAAQKKSRRKKIAAAAVVGAVGVAAYGGYQRHQDKKFDALPGITLYHNNNRNVARKGFAVSGRIERAYGADYAFFSNTQGGRARGFGKKEFKIKYTGPLTTDLEALSRLPRGGAGKNPVDILRESAVIGAGDLKSVKGLGVMRDYVDENNFLGKGMARKGEQFMMISMADLEGNYKIKRSTIFNFSRKNRANFNNFATKAQKVHSRAFHGPSRMDLVQQSPAESFAEMGPLNLIRAQIDGQKIMQRVAVAKAMEFASPIRHAPRARRVRNARQRAGVVI